MLVCPALLHKSKHKAAAAKLKVSAETDTERDDPGEGAPARVLRPRQAGLRLLPGDEFGRPLLRCDFCGFGRVCVSVCLWPEFGR